MHEIQKTILKNLLLEKELRFSDLNSEKISNDRFNFHLKRLIKEGIVSKRKDGLYCLTSVGKEYANRFDIDGGRVVLERQAKLAILVVCQKKDKFLIQQRQKEPYYGFHGFISGKIKWGETIEHASERELSEEAGLKASFSLEGIEHKIDYSLKGNLLEDKYFFIVKAKNPKGTFKKKFNAGENYWFSKEEISLLPNLFGDVPKILEAVEKKEMIFFEDKYEVEKY